MRGVRRCAGPRLASFPDGYHEREVVAGCVRKGSLRARVCCRRRCSFCLNRDSEFRGDPLTATAVEIRHKTKVRRDALPNPSARWRPTEAARDPDAKEWVRTGLDRGQTCRRLRYSTGPRSSFHGIVALRLAAVSVRFAGSDRGPCRAGPGPRVRSSPLDSQRACDARCESPVVIISSKRPSSPGPPAIQLAFMTFTRRICSLAPGTGSF
jgi:hypothetical protein